MLCQFRIDGILASWLIWIKFSDEDVYTLSTLVTGLHQLSENCGMVSWVACLLLLDLIWGQPVSTMTSTGGDGSSAWHIDEAVGAGI